MPQTRECDYCGDDVEPGTGTMFVRTDGTTIHYCSSKCEKNAELGREPRDVEWTEAGQAGGGSAGVEESVDAGEETLADQETESVDRDAAAVEAAEEAGDVDTGFEEEVEDAVEHEDADEDEETGDESDDEETSEDEEVDDAAGGDEVAGADADEAEESDEDADAEAEAETEDVDADAAADADADEDGADEA